MNMRKLIRRFLAFPARELCRLAVSPEDNCICFESSPDFSDNAWALFQYMIENGYNEKYSLHWIADRERDDLCRLKNVHVTRRSDYLAAVKLLYRSKFVFYTHGMTGLIRIRDDQTVVNLWHGCGYKASRNKDVHGKFSIRKLLNSSKMNFDYVLVPGDAFVKTKSVFFHCPESQVLPIGYPRYDLLHRADVDWNRVKERWGLGDRKLVMWLPTYRRTGNASYGENSMENQYWLPLLRSDEDLQILNRFCAEQDVMLVVKKHRLQSVFFKDGELSNIRFVDDGDLEELGVQLYEILQFTDAMLTDYSSAAVDYLLLDKPLAFTLDDYEEYAAKRGFVFEDAKAYMPGHHVYRLEELEGFLRDVREGRDDYAEKRHALLPMLQNPCSGYSRRVLDYFGITI